MAIVSLAFSLFAAMSGDAWLKKVALLVAAVTLAANAVVTIYQTVRLRRNLK